MIAALLAGMILSSPVMQAQPVNTDNNNLPKCKYEDGSGQRRCVWDAKHQGNGSGQSLLVLNGGTDRAVYVRLSHREAHRLTH